MQITLDTNHMDARDGASIITLIMTLWPEAADVMTRATYALKGADFSEIEARVLARARDTGRNEGEIAEAPARVLAVTAAEAFAPPAGDLPEQTAAEAFPFVDTATAAATSTGTASLAPADALQPPSSVATPPASAELDVNGLPWDARINSAGRAKTKDGAWRLKRDIPEATRKAVIRELRAVMDAPGPFAGSATAATSAPATTPASSSGVSEAGPTAQTIASPSKEGAAHSPPASAPPAPAPIPPSAPAAPAPAAAPAPSAQEQTAPPAPAAPAATGTAAAAAEFARVMRKVTEAQNKGATHEGHIVPSLTAAGLTQMRDLLTRSDLLPVFEETFDALIAAGAA